MKGYFIITKMCTIYYYFFTGERFYIYNPTIFWNKPNFDFSSKSFLIVKITLKLLLCVCVMLSTHCCTTHTGTRFKNVVCCNLLQVFWSWGLLSWSLKFLESSGFRVKFIDYFWDGNVKLNVRSMYKTARLWSLSWLLELWISI